MLVLVWFGLFSRSSISQLSYPNYYHFKQQNLFLNTVVANKKLAWGKAAFDVSVARKFLCGKLSQVLVFLFWVVKLAFIRKEKRELIWSGKDISISVGLLEILLTLYCGLEAQYTEVITYIGPADWYL